MEQLSELIVERISRIQELSKGPISLQRFRLLKQEEKGRCEKENFMLAMMRANKPAQIVSKKYAYLDSSLYYRYSYEIMRRINPEFTHSVELQKLEETFLNDFVGLYRLFFYKYEQTFHFKLKIQNLIRPTNHNLVIDLIRYLVDFTRDYYQLTFCWYMKQGKAERDGEDTRDMQQSAEIQKQQSQDSVKQQSQEGDKQVAIVKKIGRASLNQIVLQRSISKRPDESDLSRKQAQKNYEILDITGLPCISCQPKDSTTNVEVLKIRINEYYRQMKARNALAKANVSSYYGRYFGEAEPKQRDYVELEDDELNKATHPFKLTLNLEKNGFNFISVSYSENKFYVRSKDKKLSPIKASQRLIPIIQNRSTKQDYMLNSLKVIRISDNFLPPIINQTNITNSTIATSTITTSTAASKAATPQNFTRLNLISSNSAPNQEQAYQKIKKRHHHLSESANYSIVAQKIAKEKSHRQLNQIKRNFRSEDKREGIVLKSNNINTNFCNDPEKKIFDWLEKLRQVKQIERRKIMGLS